VFGIFSPNQKRPISGHFSPFFSHVAPACYAGSRHKKQDLPAFCLFILQKDKNYPNMASFLLSAENPEQALRKDCPFGLVGCQVEIGG
jgi:hypothetical protein